MEKKFDNIDFFVMIISRQQFTEGCGCDPLGGIISINDLRTKVSGHVLIN